MLSQQVGCNLSSLELAQSGLGEVVDRLGDLGEFVLLAHGVDLVDGINMDEDQNTVYRENLFSVDFEENPMFTRVKQGSLFGNVGLSGVLLSVFRERCVSPEIDVVVGMEHPGAALDLECYHHQFH